MQSASAQSHAEQLKLRMRLQKKLREIEKLEAQVTPLQANQITKLAQKQEVQDALLALGPPPTQVVVITPGGRAVASVQMERCSTAMDLLNVLAAKGVATLHRHRLILQDRTLKPNDTLHTCDDAEDQPLELTLVGIATCYLGSGTVDGRVSLWEIGPGQSGQISLEGHAGTITCSQFTPDGRILLTASSDGAAKLWSVESGECLHTLAGFQANVPIYTAAFSPDGAHLVLSQKHGDMHGERPGVTVWRTQDGKRTRSLWIDGEMVGFEAAWSPAGDLIATCSGECSAWIFCAETGIPVQCLDHGFCDCSGVFFSPDGRFVCTTAAGSIFIRRAEDMWRSNFTGREWDIKNQAPLVFTSRLAWPSVSTQLRPVGLSSSGLCALAVPVDSGHGTKVDIVNVDNDQNTVFSVPADSPVLSLQFDARGAALIVLTELEPPCLWNVADGTCLRSFGALSTRILTCSPDGALGW